MPAASRKKKKIRKFRVSCLLLGFFLGGCSLGPRYLAKEFHPPQIIAVLPFDNETNDVEGPELVRKALIEVLPRRGYLVLDKESVDTVLREKFGITDGGQLRA